MKSSVCFNKKELGTIEGKNVMELIENNFDLFKETIEKEIGNQSGYELNRVYIERTGEECLLHVIGQGDDSLLNYDPAEDQEKEVVFEIRGISADEFSGSYEFELTEKKKFSPYDEENFSDKSSALGVLEGTIDSFVNIRKGVDYPTTRVWRQYPNLKKANISMYINQLMVQFIFLGVKKTQKNESKLQLIEKLVNVLGEIKDDRPLNAMENLMYHKTLSYFRKEGKATALKYFRAKSGKTQSEVAEALGMSLRQYQRYEQVNSSLGNAKKVVIEKIAEEIGVSAPDLIKDGIVILR